MKQMSTTLQLITRLIEGALNAINRVNKRKAVDNAADTISNGGVQRDVDISIGDLADKSGSGKD